MRRGDCDISIRCTHCSVTALASFRRYHGEYCVQLDSHRSSGEYPEPSRPFKIVAWLLFSTPRTYLNRIRKIWVDQVVDHQQWRSLMSELQEDWLAAITPVRSRRPSQYPHPNIEGHCPFVNRPVGHRHLDDQCRLPCNPKCRPERVARFAHPRQKCRTDSRLHVDGVEYREHRRMHSSGAAAPAKISFVCHPGGASSIIYLTQYSFRSLLIPPSDAFQADYFAARAPTLRGMEKLAIVYAIPTAFFFWA